jgi:hypothetical protein
VKADEEHTDDASDSEEPDATPYSHSKARSHSSADEIVLAAGSETSAGLVLNTGPTAATPQSGQSASTSEVPSKSTNIENSAAAAAASKSRTASPVQRLGLTKRVVSNPDLQKPATRARPQLSRKSAFPQLMHTPGVPASEAPGEASAAGTASDALPSLCCF